MMSKERELLKKILATGWLNNTIYCREVEELLAQPEPIKEREVSGKIISTDDACNWNLTVGALKDYDHVYVNGIRYTEYQPDINTQYLLDQVSRLTAENAMLKEKWLAQPEPEQEPLSDEEIADLWWNNYVGTADSVRNFARGIEKAHGIGGGE
jgi:hypothetical protein